MPVSLSSYTFFCIYLCCHEVAVQVSCSQMNTTRKESVIMVLLCCFWCISLHGCRVMLPRTPGTPEIKLKNTIFCYSRLSRFSGQNRKILHALRYWCRTSRHTGMTECLYSKSNFSKTRWMLFHVNNQSSVQSSLFFLPQRVDFWHIFPVVFYVIPLLYSFIIIICYLFHLLTRLTNILLHLSIYFNNVYFL